MKLKKEDLIESYRKYRLRKQLRRLNDYNRYEDIREPIDTANKREVRIRGSKKASDEQVTALYQKGLLRTADRIARETGERIDPSNNDNINYYNMQFAKRGHAQWLIGADLPRERKTALTFLRYRMNRRGML
jgi:hypothetical protein